MTIRPLVYLPDPRLRLKSEPVRRIDDSLRALVKDMFHTMYEAPGIGLAAVQIGVLKRVVTIDLSRKEETAAPMVFLNPVIVSSSETRRIHEEGCLSIPEYYGEVERPADVRVRYKGLDGAVMEIDAEGVLATCLQHEIDHLNGVLFIDYLSKLKRDRVTKKFAKAAKREKDE